MATFQTKFSKEIDRKWVRLEFGGDGVLSINGGAVRVVLGDVPEPEAEDVDNVGNMLEPNEGRHEFSAGQVLWVRATEGLSVVTLEEEV